MKAKRTSLCLDEATYDKVIVSWLWHTGAGSLKILRAKEPGYYVVQVDIKENDQDTLFFVNDVIKQTNCRVHTQDVDI